MTLSGKFSFGVLKSELKAYLELTFSIKDELRTSSSKAVTTAIRISAAAVGSRPAA